MTTDVIDKDDEAVEKLFDGDDTTGEPEGDEAKAEAEAKESKETVPPTDEEPKVVPIAALHDKRRQVDSLKEEVETLRKQIPKTEPDKPKLPDDVYDEEAMAKYASDLESWTTDKVRREAEQASSDEYQKKVEDSRSAMLTKHDDYEQMEKTFMFLTSYDENLIVEMKASADPALFAYEKGKAYLDEQRETLKTELIASGYTKKEAEKEIAETEKEPVKAPSLATATAVASNSPPVEDDTDDDMFADQNY